LEKMREVEAEGKKKYGCPYLPIRPGGGILLQTGGEGNGRAVERELEEIDLPGMDRIAKNNGRG